MVSIFLSGKFGECVGIVDEDQLPWNVFDAVRLRCGHGQNEGNSRAMGLARRKRERPTTALFPGTMFFDHRNESG
jgi:hypothetical protein